MEKKHDAKLAGLTKAIAEKIGGALSHFGYDNCVYVVCIQNLSDGETIVSSNMLVDGCEALLQESLNAIPREETGNGASPDNGPVH